MSIIASDGARDGGGGRPLAYVVAHGPDDIRLIVQPGARTRDVAAAASMLPAGAVFAAQHELVLPFHLDALPAADAATVAGDGGWVPEPYLPADPTPPVERVGRLRTRHGRTPVAAFWTIAEGVVVSGPWDGRAEAEAAGADRAGSSVAYGGLSADGTFTYRTAPDDLALSRTVAAAVAGIVDDDDGPVRATRDAVAMLTITVARALVLAGLPVATTTGRGEPTGGVLLAPTRFPTPGVAVWWVTHVRAALDSAGPAGRYVAPVMATAVAGALDAAGFTVAYSPRHGGVPLVTAGPTTTSTTTR